MRIGVDVMGSDSSPEDLFQGVLAAARELSRVDTLCVFALNHLVPKLTALCADTSGADVEVIGVSEEITMDDAPLMAVRRKKDSSMVEGIKMVRDSYLDAFVSAGNTGALVASATMILSTMPGIDRAGLLASLPTRAGDVAVLDVGGNVSVKARHLVQFAQIGAAYQQCRHGIASPKVGLLNIGNESMKGTSEVREAYQTLQQVSEQVAAMTFVGNVEGREVFQGKVDVLVTDGFTGNVFLKTAEGVSAFLLQHVHELVAGEAKESVRNAVRELERHVSYEEYPGALVCGVNGVVIKCHGLSSALGMRNGIRGAAALVDKRLLDRIKTQLGSA